jgi:fructose-1,6-bisphosphatase
MEDEKEALIPRKSFLRELKIKSLESQRLEIEQLRKDEEKNEQKVMEWIMNENSWDYNIHTDEYYLEDTDFPMLNIDNNNILTQVEKYVGEEITAFRSVCMNRCDKWQTTKNCTCLQFRYFKFKD